MKKRFTKGQIAFALRQAEGGTPVTEVFRPGKPVENASIESFNGKLREECLNLHWSKSIEEAKEKIEAWRIDCNRHRPHRSLNNQTPSEFAENFDLSRDVEKAGY